MIGTTVSHYNITEKLGEGGMGVVYKARDTKLDRDIALKFLPPHLSASEEDKARFIQEAKAAATLDHPNICTIHSIEEHEGQLFIAMQFVDGQLLRDRMSSMTQKQAIDIGIQVADGLAAAHENGIVHRDIKPENIMVRKDGIVQIMDFGLAKLKGVSRLTKEGSTVGTAGYMSPEQVQGQDADHRSDIFSLGVLLYEMVVSQLPFKGVHETAIAYEIVNVDALPMSAVKPELDPGLDAIVLECLEKDPNERAQSAKQVGIDLKRHKRESSKQKASRITAARPVYQSGITPAQGGAAPPPTVPEQKRTGEMVAWGVAGICLLAALYLLFSRSPDEGANAIPIHSSIVLPDSLYVHSYGVRMGPPVLSPSGEALAFAGVAPDGSQFLYVRRMDEMEATPLAGTRDAAMPFWSPDGRVLGFFQGQRMKKIDLVGGSPQTIAIVPNARGGTWASDGTIVYTPDYQADLFRVPADGSAEPVQVTSRDSTIGEGSHRWPMFLPDGEHVLYLSRAISESGDAEGDAVYVSSLDGAVTKRLVESTFNPGYSDDYLLFGRAENLYAQKFNISSLSLEGDPIELVDGLLSDISYNIAVFSAQSGTLIYQTGEAVAGARPIFLDRSGKIVRVLEDRSEQDQPRFSPDGRQVALYLFDTRSRRSNIWIYDLRTDGRRRLSTRFGGDFFPVWSRDQREIFFSSGTAGRRNIFRISAGHSGPGEEFYRTDGETAARDVSLDGSALLVETRQYESRTSDLWIVPVDNPEEAVPFQQTKFDEQWGRVSADGGWVVFTSDESGQDEVYIKEIGDPDASMSKVSSDGAVQPVWGADNSEVLYVNYDRMMVSKKLRISGSTVEVISSEELFRIPPFMLTYDISRDGRTFAITRSLEIQDLESMSIVVNWKGLLSQ